MARFLKSLRKRRSAIFCVRCGSTHIDGSSFVRLECRSCGNSIAWDGLSFNLATVHSSKRATTVVVSGVEEAFAVRERTPPWVEASELPCRENGDSGEKRHLKECGGEAGRAKGSRDENFAYMPNGTM